MKGRIISVQIFRVLAQFYLILQLCQSNSIYSICTERFVTGNFVVFAQ